MAIGPGNKITTTGLIDKKPMIPAVPVMENPQQVQPPTQAQVTPPVADSQANTEMTTRLGGTQNLTDEDIESLEAALSPSVKEALSKVFPDLASAIDQLGTDEPNVIFPLSYIVNFAMTRYGGTDEQEAVNNFMADVQSMNQQMENQNNVPPGTEQPTNETAGLMTSPQNMETV
jgi:hypothetical protein